MPTKFVTNPRRPPAYISRSQKKAYIDLHDIGHRRNPTTASGDVTPRVFLLVLRSKLTQHDAKLSAKQPNLYRLGHYLAAAERVEKAMGRSLDSTSPAALEKFKKSVHKAFEMPFAPASAVERQVDAYLAKGTTPSLTRNNPSDLKPGMRVGKYRVEEVRKRDIIVSYDRKKGDGRELYRVEGTTRADLEHAARTLDSVFFSSEGMPEHEYARNPRRKNPPKGFRIAGPAVKTMSEQLRISKADAQKLKDMMDTGAPRILQTADKMMDGHGVERISGAGGGLMYVNMGDTYNTTLIYDYKTNRFVVSSWGDIVERQPRRFAD